MLKKEGLKDAYRLMHYGALSLARAERQGIRLDLKFAKSKKKELTKKIDALEASFLKTKFYKHWKHSRGGKTVNINSDDQLGFFLYKIKKLKPAKLTDTGKGSTDLEALEALNIKELVDLIQIKKLKKLRDTYLAQFIREEVNGYIHPFFNLHLPVTYRSSSDSPNFQNIPVRDEESKATIRKCLYPRWLHQLLELDFKSIEVGIGACYHKDPAMLRYLKDKSTDMHRDTAKQIFFIDKFNGDDKTHDTLRSGSKNGFVFPQFYGDYFGNNAISLAKWAKLPAKGRWKDKDGLIMPGGQPLATHLASNGVYSINEFTEHLRDIEHHFWNERFPVYNDWKKSWWRRYQKQGYIEMLTGFRCSGVMNQKEVCNYPIQGSAFHCLLWCFNELDRIMMKEKWDTKLIGQIHDSIIFDTNPDERKHVIEVAKKVTCSDLLEKYKWIIIPLQIEAEICKVDESWYFKDKIKI